MRLNSEAITTTSSSSKIIAFTTTRRRIKSLQQYSNGNNDIQSPSISAKKTKKKKSRGTKKSKINISKPKSRNIKTKATAVKKTKKTETKAAKTVTPFEQRWNDKYNELINYKSIHGHCNIPQNDKDNPSLGRWVRAQRLEYTHLFRPYLYNCNNYDDFLKQQTVWFENKELKKIVSTLPPRNIERIQKLNDIGFVWDVKEDVWFKRVQDLIEFKNIYGHVRVPQRWPDRDEENNQCDNDWSDDNFADENTCSEEHGDGKRWRRLGLWVRNQRAQYKSLRNGSKKNHFLTEKRIELLEDIGFCWDVQESIWNERYDSLRKFTESHGHADVPCSYEDDPTLARWVMQIRYVYREMNKQQKKTNKGLGTDVERWGKVKSSSDNYMTKLTPERIELLNDIGFVWDKNDAYWWEQYRALVEFRRMNGHCFVPPDHHNVQLRNWVMNMRRLYRKFEREKLRRSQNGVDGGDEAVLHVPGLNEERLMALRKIDFTTTTPVSTFANNWNDQSLNNKVQQVQKVQIQQPKEKKFIPFPWDEI